MAAKGISACFQDANWVAPFSLGCLILSRQRRRNVACAGQERQRQEAMRQILEIEEHVAVPPMMYADPFYRITYLIKEEIRIS